MSSRRVAESSWTALIERIARGDGEAMAELYDLSSALVFGLALRILADRSIAEDVVLEVYSQVWSSAYRFSAARGSVSAWLLTIARSRAIDALRVRHRHACAEDAPELNSVCSSDPDPELAALLAEKRRLVRRALDRLSREQREAIELAYFAGLSHSEIAARLAQPLGTIKTRVRLGMMRLRELLAPIGSAAEPALQERTE